MLYVRAVLRRHHHEGTCSCASYRGHPTVTYSFSIMHASLQPNQQATLPTSEPPASKPPVSIFIIRDSDPGRPQHALKAEGDEHWNHGAGKHIQNTTRFRFHPYHPGPGRERGFEVCSTADVFYRNRQGRGGEVLDISVMGRRLHCATKISGADSDQAIERDYAFFLKALVQLAEREQLRNRYVVDVKEESNREHAA